MTHFELTLSNLYNVFLLLPCIPNKIFQAFETFKKKCFISLISGSHHFVRSLSEFLEVALDCERPFRFGFGLARFIPPNTPDVDGAHELAHERRVVVERPERLLKQTTEGVP